MTSDKRKYDLDISSITALVLSMKIENFLKKFFPKLEKFFTRKLPVHGKLESKNYVLEATSLQ